jgi:hypothetical protein
MLCHDREARYRGDAVDCSEEEPDPLYRDDPAFSDDPLLTIAYDVSEWVIAFLGPVFGMSLALPLPGRRAGALGRHSMLQRGQLPPAPRMKRLLRGG